VSKGNSLSLVSPLFDLLRKEGFELGVEEFKLVVLGLERGLFVSDDISTLERFLLRVWAKNDFQENKLKFHFQAICREAVIKKEPLQKQEEVKENSQVKGAQGRHKSRSDLDSRSFGDLENDDREEYYESESNRSESEKKSTRHGIDRNFIPQEYEGNVEPIVTIKARLRGLPFSERSIHRLSNSIVGANKSLPKNSIVNLRETLSNIGRTGFLNKLVYDIEYHKEGKIILMIDRTDAMEPFSLMESALIEWFKSSQEQQELLVRSFYKIPMLENLNVTEKGREEPFLLIFSDAGVAKGYPENSRIFKTIRFLDEQLGITKNQICWLNPYPSIRWKNTSAEEIAKRVPMIHFEESEVLKMARKLKIQNES